MLKRAPSLATRAALAFASVYAAILLAVAAVSSAATWVDRGAGNLSGPGLAIDYAAADLRAAGGGWRLAGGGRFADLRRRNPGLWLVALRDGRAFAAGAAGPTELDAVSHHRDAIGPATFRIPGRSLPLGAAALQQRETQSGPVILAAGGVDPASLSTRESVQLLLDPALLLMLTVIGVISLVAMLVAVPSFARALRPIVADAASIGPHDPARRLDERRAPAELRPLVGVFNAGLDRLETELGRRKRFVIDVAHELRTPLAVVALQVERLPDGDAKAELGRSVGRLTSIVVQMLDLERLSLDSGRRSLVDLVALVRDVVADLAPLAIAASRDLALTAPDRAVAVAGNAPAIARAVTNLIGNAIAHGGGVIGVAIGEDCTIKVADDGPGVAPELRPRLFEPFSRGDPSAPGCGLGLHLTREIMRAHGGAISLLPVTSGVTFQLTFPAPDRADRGAHD